MSLVTWMNFIIDVINIIFEEDLRPESDLFYSQGEARNDEGKDKSRQNEEYLKVKCLLIMLVMKCLKNKLSIQCTLCLSFSFFLHRSPQ